MPSINQFLKQLAQGDSIKDYQHASRIFVGDNYRLSPKYAFLFHVAFDLNSEITRMPRDQVLEMGMIVKTASLPKFTVDTKTLNAYNRVNVVQNKIKYDPVSITFHDDSADIVRDFWYDYYSYYYRDSDYTEANYSAPHKYDIRQQQQWGYTPRQYPRSVAGTQQFIRAIRLYSLHQKRFTEYVLINPTITQFQHGEHQNGTNDFMQHTMTVSYETVKYRYGYVSKDTVSGFADLHYDHSPSPLTPAGGGTRSILGPGGLLNSIDDITGDLADGNYLAALFKGGRTLQNFRGADLKGIAGAELASLGKDILRGNNPMGRVNIPSWDGARRLGGSMFGGGGGVAGIGAAGALFGGIGIGSKKSGKIVSNGESIDSAYEVDNSNYDPYADFPSYNDEYVDSSGMKHYIDENGNEVVTDVNGGITVITPDGQVQSFEPNQESSGMNFVDYHDEGLEPTLNADDWGYSDQHEVESDYAYYSEDVDLTELT